MNWTKYSTAANPEARSPSCRSSRPRRTGHTKFFSGWRGSEGRCQERRDSSTSTVVDTEVPASIVLAAGEAV